MSFATVSDVLARWPSAPDDDERIAALLDDAGMVLSSMFAIPARPDEQLQGVLRMVSCAMVKRALLAETSGHFQSTSYTAGPFSESMTYRNPEGNLYLTGQEREMIENALGKGRGMVTMEATGW